MPKCGLQARLPLPIHAATAAFNMNNNRHFTLDALRGIAVMGILLMNVIGFAMPMAAYVNPRAWGGETTADLIAWAAAFVLVEGKMRGIFSLLFGASLLLVIVRAEAKGADTANVHFSRMFWLFLFGLFHYWFIWDGDILALYAVCGCAAYALRGLAPRQLMLAGVALMALNLLIWAITLLAVHDMRHDALLPGADAALVQELATVLAEFGEPDSALIAAQLQLHLGPYQSIAGSRLADHISAPFILIYAYGPETLGLMAWGMALMKSGLLTGGWPRRRYARAAVLAYAIGLPLSALLAWACWASSFETLLTADIYYVANLPVRMMVMIGHVMALLWVVTKAPTGALLRRIAAAGRMALSNYLATSVLMTTLYYGYGLALYGQLTRWEVYLTVVPIWGLMLLWSAPWLAHFNYGPLEWVWRSLARRQFQPMRITKG
jgi:uncharacterized protein